MPRLPVEIAAALEEFAAGPRLLRAAIAGVDAGTLNRRPAWSDWSMRDHVMHLADSELVAAVQIRMLVASDEGADPVLPTEDGELWKRRLSYLWRDVDAALALFQHLRYTTGEMLEHSDAARLRRTGLHPALGPVTSASLLRTRADHDREHISEIDQIRGAVNEE